MSMAMRKFLSLISALFVHSYVTAVPFAQLTCNSDWLRLTFNKTELDAIGRNYTIAFSGNHQWWRCKIRSEDLYYWQYIYLHSSYDSCGIKAVYEGSDIVYTQKVVLTYENNASRSIIQRQQDETYNLRCKIPRNHTGSAAVNVERSMGRVTDKVGSSNFEVYLRAYADSSFSYYRYRRNFKLGDMLYFELSFYNYHSNIGMYPQDCYATSKNGTEKYYLIEDRCINPEDGTIKILTSPNDMKRFRWQMEAFRYFGDSDEVYIYCDVLICIRSSGYGCTRSCGNNSTRYRREVSNINNNVEETTKKIAISSFPFIITDEKQGIPNNSEKREKNSVLSGTQGTIIIVLIALLVIIVAAGVVKKAFLTPPKTTTVEMPFTQKGIECGYVNQAMEK